jgi:RNA-directed DNA polymerase
VGEARYASLLGRRPRSRGDWGKIGWVLEADLKNFFGSLDHDWVLRFVEHRVGDPRLINLIRRWLKAGVLEDGAVHPSEEGTPQGGSISVLLSNLYLHHALDLWFERVVKCRLRGEAHLVRYIDDFVICFQYRSDTLRVQDALRLRLDKFSLTLEPTKTKLVEFGRFAQRHAGKRGRNRPESQRRFESRLKPTVSISGRRADDASD